MQAQSYLQSYYTELASRRGNHARRISGMEEVKFAEALAAHTALGGEKPMNKR